MKAFGQHVLVVLFIHPYNLVLTFESVEEIPKRDYSKRHQALLSCGTVYYTAQGGCNFKFCLRNLKCGHSIQMKAFEQHFSVVLFIMLYKMVVTFESVDEIPEYGHLNENY